METLQAVQVQVQIKDLMEEKTGTSIFFTPHGSLALLTPVRLQNLLSSLPPSLLALIGSNFPKAPATLNPTLVFPRHYRLHWTLPRSILCLPEIIDCLKPCIHHAAGASRMPVGAVSSFNTSLRP